jgi:hypothetical protein
METSGPDDDAATKLLSPSGLDAGVLRAMAGEGAAAVCGCRAASLYMSRRAPGVPPW